MVLNTISSKCLQNLTKFVNKKNFYEKKLKIYIILFLVRVGHSVLFRSVRYVLLRSKKRPLRSFPFFSRVFGDLWDPQERYLLFRSFLKNGKERKERNVLLQRTEKNGKNAPFFCKEQKRTRERSVLLQKERENVTFFFRDIYRDIYRYI